MEAGRTVTYGELSDVQLADGTRTDWVVSLLRTIDAGRQAVLADPEWTAAERRSAIDALVAPDNGEAGLWLFTSGTTARPKPRFRSVAAVTAMLERVRARLPPAVAGGRPSTVAMVPLHHGFGVLNSLLLVHLLGGTVHLGDADAAPTIIGEHDIRVLYAWPPHLVTLAERGVKTHLEWCVSSSRRLDAEVARHFAERTGCSVRQQYGTTEAGPLTVDTGDPPDPACVGTALDGIDLRVVDGDGTEQPAGTEGRVAVRPSEWFAPQLEPASDGRYYPGDRGWMDAEGRLFLTSRDPPFYDERADVGG